MSDDRRRFLFWVLEFCELTDGERAFLRDLIRASGPIQSTEAPTMVFQAPADSRSDLGAASRDSYAREVLDEDRTYISIQDYGWVPLKDF